MSDSAQAKLAAQREARRRKITQNASARMNRLLGQAPDSTGSETNSSIPAEQVDLSPQLGKDEAQNQFDQSPTHHAPAYNLRRRTQRSESPSVVPGPTDVAAQDPTRETATGEETSSQALPSLKTESVMFESATSRISQPSQDVPPLETRPDPATSATTTTTRSVESSRNRDAKSVEVLRVVACVVTAFLARYTLRFGFGIFMVESIFLPFICMEAVFTYLLETQALGSNVVPGKNTLISAALMLCGIKPELMGVYHRIMGHVGMVASDFGMFLFSFVVWHSLVM